MHKIFTFEFSTCECSLLLKVFTKYYSKIEYLSIFADDLASPLLNIYAEEEEFRFIDTEITLNRLRKPIRDIS